MAVTHLTDGNDDGTSFGQSASEKISFYGKTPLVQATLANASVATTVATSTSPWGFSGSTQANAIVALLNEIRTSLVNLGLVA